MPFYEELKKLGVLTEGRKTVPLNGVSDETIDVYGTMYNGELMGRGEYTSSNGTETKTYFYKDV